MSFSSSNFFSMIGEKIPRFLRKEAVNNQDKGERKVNNQDG